MTGARALTHRDDGAALNPTTPKQWQQWVSAARTRNFLLHDTLVDWLDLYGVAKGFSPDIRDPRTDFTPFIFAQGLAFEVEGVIAHLRTLTPITTIATDHADARSLAKAEDTVQAMVRGDAVIYQGVLRDPEWRTYGIPDLLVRSDVLNQLFPYTLAPLVASRTAPALGSRPWHYVVVDIKFTTLNLLANWELGNSGSSRAFKGQLYVYTRALGRLQGFTPDNGYLIGRSWRGSGSAAETTT